jgi:hypothetical protein
MLLLDWELHTPGLRRHNEVLQRDSIFVPEHSAVCDQGDTAENAGLAQQLAQK